MFLSWMQKKAVANIFLALAIGASLAVVPGAVHSAKKWPNETKLRQKIQDFVSDFVGSSGVPLKKNAEIMINLVDLNKDGTPEAFLVINGFNFCGSRGCSSFVLDLTGAKARSIGDFIAMKLVVLPSATGGWQDISLNGMKRISFKSGKYGR